MKKNFLKQSLLSLTASTLLVSGLSGADIVSASINLADYNSTQVVYNNILDQANIDEMTKEANDGNMTIYIKNASNEYNISLKFEYNNSKSAYFSIVDDADLNKSKIIRGNTQQNDINVTTWTDANMSKKIVSTIGALSSLVQDKWNLVTMPFDKTTNAKEVVKSGKVSMIWGWDDSATAGTYAWNDYPENMKSGNGYWIRTRANVSGSADLSSVVASDYNATMAVANSKERNVTASIISGSTKNQWELLGLPSTANVVITSTKPADENNDTKVWFESLLNATEECYFVSIYHWNATTSAWINDTEGGATATSTPIPQNSGLWVKQRLCKD